MTEWRLVPVETTYEMDKAGADTFGGQGDSADARYECAVMYRAMVAAAPQPPAAQEAAGWPIKGRVWLRESTNEKVLELEGTINDTHVISRHSYPPDIPDEDVLDHLFAHPAPADDRVRELSVQAASHLLSKAIEELSLLGTKADPVAVNNLRHCIESARAALANGGK